jgi:hypothetical protein
MDTPLKAPYEPYTGRTVLWRLRYAGRNDAPDILFDGLVSGEIQLTKADLHDLVANVWSGAEYPQAVGDADLWVRLFEDADYPKPSVPLTIYRGAAPTNVHRMSWTTDQEMAHWFAERIQKMTGQPSAVYRTVIYPSGVLADIDSLEPRGRRESEIVVKPAMLGEIRQHKR